MVIDFILAKFTRKYRETFMDTSLDRLKIILALKEELITIGYNPGEVNYMINTFCNGVDIVKMDSKQLRKIEEQLQAQIAIAKQCLDFINDSQ